MIFLVMTIRNLSHIILEFGWEAPSRSIDILQNMKDSQVARFARVAGQSGPPYPGKAGHLKKQIKNLFTTINALQTLT